MILVSKNIIIETLLASTYLPSHLAIEGFVDANTHQELVAMFEFDTLF